MFTVLIAEKEHIDAIRKKNKLFFEPFLNSEDLAFCYWNPSGRTLSESVPELIDTVGRTKQWRAVVINNTPKELLSAQNPFDVVDYSKVRDLLTPEQADKDNKQEQEEEEVQKKDFLPKWQAYFEALAKEKEEVYRNALSYPLQKLATWLCFKPEEYVLNDVQKKQSDRDQSVDAEDPTQVTVQRKNSEELEKLEREQYKYEQRIKEQMRRDFVDGNYLRVAHPLEFHCISIRTSEDTFFDPDIYWNIPDESDYSSFADRNMYFDKMRFMVFDLLPEEHRNFRTDYIRFLASVLIFSSNPMPTSVMKMRKLYVLDSETDDTPLCTLVTSYDRKLAATSENIEGEMEKIRSEIPDNLTDKTAEALFCTPNDIPVLLDETCKTEDVFVKNDYGLSADCPEDEYYKWGRSLRSSQEALTYIIKQQSRAVKKGVIQTHFSSEVIDVNINRLTPIQIDDIRDYTNASEDEMVAAIPPDFTDISVYTKRMAEESEKVKKVINRRMSKKATIIIAAICLLVYLLCFLPFFFTNNSTSETVATAFGFTGIMLGALAIIMLITLFFLRRPLRLAVKEFNRVAKMVVNDIEGSLKDVSKYLSAVCNVCRGHSIQNYAEKNVDEYTRGLRIRRKHQEDIRKRRAFIKEEYGDYLADSSYCDEVMSRPYEYDFDQTVEHEYPAPFLAGDTRQVEFLSSGNFVTAPSSYIKKMTVRMEGIYDK